MSLKLLKQSMDILEEDLSTATAKKVLDKQPNKNQSKTFSKQYKANKHPYEARSKQERKKNLKDVQKEMQMDNLKAELNMKRLLALSQNTVKVKDAEKIVKRAHKGRYEADIELPPPEQESIFTEEDFKKFEEEYFLS